MKCPHCSVNFHDHWHASSVSCGPYNTTIAQVDTTKCPVCEQYTLLATMPDNSARMIYPGGADRGPVPKEVPAEIAEDYIEACNVLPISPKASAALARRCLQNILRKHGYKATSLAKEIDLLLNEPDTSKAIPVALRATIDGIRNFGNFSAHPITDTTSLQIIAVEPHEAEWCLEILEEMFQHFYVQPAEAMRRKAALDAKLKSAGKPPSK